MILLSPAEEGALFVSESMASGGSDTSTAVPTARKQKLFIFVFCSNEDDPCTDVYLVSGSEKDCRDAEFSCSIDEDMRTSLKRTLRRLVAGLCHSLLRNFQHRTDASRGKQPKVDYPAQMKNDAAFVADLFLRFVFYKHLASGVLYAMFINKLYCVVLECCVNIVTERNT